MTRLSVVIPVLNEARALPLLLAELQGQSGIEIETIVVDGGSTDGCADLARAAGVQCLAGPRGRGAQMNAGAAQARGRLLLFLHADSRLPDAQFLLAAAERLDAECRQRDSQRVAGHFALGFERRQAGFDRVFAYLEAKTTLGRPGTINGDQGTLLPAGYFRELGGFEARLPFLEDQKLAVRIFRSGHWILLPGQLRTSARRFETEGTPQRLSLMALLMGLHAAGLDDLLAELPGIYAQQDKAAPLKLAVFHRHVRRALWRARWRGLARILHAGGHYVRNNAWQLAFRRDVLRSGRAAACDHPSLDFFDRRIAALLDHRAADALGALLVAVWLYVWLPLTENR